MRAAVRVIGSTAARVSTSQRETGSSVPSGGLLVANTVRQLVSRRCRDWTLATAQV